MNQGYQNEFIPQHLVREPLADPPTSEEVSLAINLTKNKKVPEPDDIPAEIFKVGELMLAQKLHHLFLKVWDSENLPPDLT